MTTNPQDIEGRSYQPVDLRGGLDLTASKFNVQPGTLQDVLNYESSDQGYTRSQGLLFYDGTWDQAIEDMWYITTTTGGGGESTLTGDTFTLGGQVEFTFAGEVFGNGIVAYWSAGAGSPATTVIGFIDMTVTTINTAGTPPGNSFTITDGTTGATLALAASLATAPSKVSEATVADTISEYLTFMNDTVNDELVSQSSEISSLIQHGKVPGEGGITGGFQLNDIVYAVRDFWPVPFENGDSFLDGFQYASLIGQEVLIQVSAASGNGGSTRFVAARIADVVVTSGDWSNRDAAGYFIIKPDYIERQWSTTGYVDGDVVDNNGRRFVCYSGHTGTAATAPGVGVDWTTVWNDNVWNDLVDLSTSDEVWSWQKGFQIADVAAASTTDQGGGMLWKATTGGWEWVDTGYTIQFDDGNRAPRTRNSPLFVSNVLSIIDSSSLAAVGSSFTTGIAPDIAWTGVTNIESDDGVYATSAIPQQNHSEYAAGSISSGSVPNLNLRITGIEVTMEAKSTGVGSTAREIVLVNLATGAEWYMSDNRGTVEDIANTDTIYTFGDSQDLWGLDTIDPADIKSGDLRVYIRCHNSNAATRTVSIDHVSITVHYVMKADKVYLNDGVTDVANCSIVAYQITNDNYTFTTDVEVAEVLATAQLELTGGTAGSVDSVTVNSIELLDTVVPWNASLSQTATDVATAIGNGNSQYTAIAAAAIITITAPVGTGDAPNDLILDGSTTTITTFSTDFAGGVDFSALPSKPAGIFTIYDLNNPWHVQAGLDIYTGSSRSGDYIGKVASMPKYNYLPSEAEMLAEDSRYENILANFFEDPEALAVYGVTGASNAFFYDGEWFSFIRTPLLQEIDKPRHVEFHVNMLALGYSTGHVLLSSVGAPFDFSGVTGGTSWGFRKGITGLQSLTGAVLSVLTRSTTSSLEGTDPSSIAQKNIQPTSGGLEYTLQHIIEPFFMDFYGLSSLSTTDKFGDFDFGHVSSVISPWVRDRLQDTHSANIEDTNYIAAITVRNKNQYRVYFKDGYMLTASFFTNRNVEFTWQHYDTAGFGSTYVPTFLSSFVLESGRERSVMGTKDGSMYIIDGANGMQESAGFTALDSYIVINPINMGRPEAVTKYYHTVVQGQFYGWQHLEAWADTNYVFDEAGTVQGTVDIGASTDATQLESTNDLDSIYLPILADGYSLKIQTSVDGSKPHTLQSLLLRASLKGTDRTRTSKAY